MRTRSVKEFEKNLVHAVIGHKDLDRGWIEFNLNLVLARSRGSMLLDLECFLDVDNPLVDCGILAPSPWTRLAGNAVLPLMV